MPVQVIVCEYREECLANSCRTAALVALCLVLVLVGCAEVQQPYLVGPGVRPDLVAVGPQLYRVVPVPAEVGTSMHGQAGADLVLAALIASAIWRQQHVRRHQARSQQTSPVVLAGHPGRRQENPHQAGRRRHHHH